MFDAVTRNITFLMGGFLVTLELTFFALIGGIILGALVGLGRIAKKNGSTIRLPGMSISCATYR